MNNFMILKVRDKKTKQEISIKAHKFNSEHHEKIEGENPIPYSEFRRGMTRVPGIITLNMEGIEANKVEKTEEKEDTITEEPRESVSEESIEIPAKIFEARKWASDRGMKVSNKTTKDDIKAWANNTKLS